MAKIRINLMLAALAAVSIFLAASCEAEKRDIRSIGGKSYATSTLSIAQEETPFKIILPDIHETDFFITSQPPRSMEWNVSFSGTARSYLKNDKADLLTVGFSNRDAIGISALLMIIPDDLGGWEVPNDLVVKVVDGVPVGSERGANENIWIFFLKCHELNYRLITYDIPYEGGLAVATSIVPGCKAATQ